VAAGKRAVQPVELAVAGAGLASLALFYNGGHPALGAVAVLILAVWAVSRAVPHWFLRALELTRHCPDAGTQDEALTFSFRARSAGARAARFFTIEDANPAAFPGERQPGFYVTRLEQDRDSSFHYQRALYKRGVYQVGPAVARCGFPLGIVEVVREIPDSVRTVHVLPRIFPLRSLPLAGLNLGVPHASLIARSGGDQNVLGVREYRRGDSPRHVHWPSTARHGQLIVKEFESERSGELCVILDLCKAAHLGAERDATFEYSASVAASVAAFALEHRQDVHLLGWADAAYHRGPASGSRGLGPLLRSLAELEPTGQTPLLKALERLAPNMPVASSVVCVFTDLNPPAVWGALAALERRNIEVCAVVLRSRTFDPNAQAHRYVPTKTIPAVYLGQGGDLSLHFAAPA